MNVKLRNRIGNRKRRIERRLDPAKRPSGAEPQFAASNIHYEMAARTRAINCGGIGVAHLLARQLGLIEAIDNDLHVLKVHLPYHESDHVLNIAYNILAGGSCLEDLELLRNDEVYLDALGTGRIPDPTTAGDFCRRFTCDAQVVGLMETQERQRPRNVKERIVEERNFENLITKWEDVAEFDYQPVACEKAYRIVALRKKIAVKMGQDVLWEEYRYFFFITNDRDLSACELVLLANQRCNQENLIEQLKNGVQAMRNPLDNLHSNWAYMVMCSLAWTLKAWMGLCLPARPSGGSGTVRHQQQKDQIVKMEFKKFLNTLMRLPCQIIKTGRRIIYRLLSWNPWVGVLARMAETFAGPMRC